MIECRISKLEVLSHRIPYSTWIYGRLVKAGMPLGRKTEGLLFFSDMINGIPQGDIHINGLLMARESDKEDIVIYKHFSEEEVANGLAHWD